MQKEKGNYDNLLSLTHKILYHFLIFIELIFFIKNEEQCPELQIKIKNI